MSKEAHKALITTLINIHEEMLSRIKNDINSVNRAIVDVEAELKMEKEELNKIELEEEKYANTSGKS